MAISDQVLVANTNFGVGIGKWGSRPVTPIPQWVDKLNQENGFYRKLEESILKDGFVNPIFCNAYKEGTFCRYGTSRLWIAKKHKLEIFAIIADYTDRWEHLNEIETREEVLNLFTDKPKILEINDDEMRIDACPHCHLKND